MLQCDGGHSRTAVTYYVLDRAPQKVLARAFATASALVRDWHHESGERERHWRLHPRAA